MSSKANVAEDLYKKGYNCAQAVLLSFCEDHGLSKSLAARISNPFGRGISGTENICGALSAAAMIIGLDMGKELPDEDEKQKRTFETTFALFKEFEDKYGCLDCPSLLELDLPPFGDWARDEKLKKKNKNCPHYVRLAADLADKYSNI